MTSRQRLILCLATLALAAFVLVPRADGQNPFNLFVAGAPAVGNSGSKTAGTLRVVLATDQPQLTNALKVDGSAVTQPVSGTVTAAQATAANLNATIVGTGTFAVQAAQSGTWTVQPGNTANTTAWLFKLDQTSTNNDVDVASALPAGTNAIGKLAANSGVDIGDVDVTSLPALPAGTNLIGQVAEGTTATTTNSASGCYIVSAASTNANNCKASAGNFYGVRVINTTSTLYYLRLYNSASASPGPTCSSATGFTESIPIPHASGNGAGMVAIGPIAIGYSTGIGYCLTSGSSSTDNTNAATGIFGAIYYK